VAFLKSSVAANDMRLRIIWIALVATSVGLTGCTTTPDKYKRNYVASSNAFYSAADQMAGSSKMQAVGSARIGESRSYNDPATGGASQLIVRSEYFSANGRVCRRYVELSQNGTRDGLGCRDNERGWIEIPLAKLLK